MPLISVIVTTYNRKDLLKITIDSILNQSFSDFEIIVVDNFSDYNFFEFIKNFKDNRIKAFQNNNKGNISVNRNFGISKATSKILAFCDDDDEWLYNKLAVQIEIYNKLLSNETAILIYTNTFLCKKGSKDILTNKHQIYSFNDFILSNPVTYSSVLLTKSEFVKFNEDIPLVAVEDFNLWLELFNNGYKFQLIADPLIKYNIAETSASRKKIKYSHLKFIIVLFQNVIKFNIETIDPLKLFYSVTTHMIKFLIRNFTWKNGK